MTEFKKYTSIENSFNEVYMNHVVEEMPDDLKYVVQEKVHGANTSFICDGTNIQFAKRTAILADDEKFYNYQETAQALRDNVLALTRDVMNSYKASSVSIFGELFGGLYKHPEVKADPHLQLIQKGICYTPQHGFYAFDIYLFTNDGGYYLPVAEANALFEKHGFFYAKTLFCGTLKECLEYPNAFESKISSWLGLPSIEDNICEGVVIRPVVPMFLRNGSRVIIKNKNERFSEKNIRKNNKRFVQVTPQNPRVKELLDVATCYATEARLTNVISHIGEVNISSAFGRVVGLLSKDILEDFLKEHAPEYETLETAEQKNLKKEINKLAVTIVKAHS